MMRGRLVFVVAQLRCIHCATWWQPPLPEKLSKSNATASDDYGFYFQISVLGKNLCLDVYGGSAANGAEIDVWSCGGWENQLWYFKPGSWEIRYAGDPSKCIDAGSSLAKGNQLMLWDCNGSPQQKIGYDSATHALYFASTNEDASSCVDVAGSSTTSGTSVQLWQCSGAWNQQWSVVAGLTIRIHLGGISDFCMDLPSGSTDDGTLIQLWQCDGLPNQLWYFEAGSYMIKYGPDMSKCVDAGDMSLGTQLKLWTCNSNYAQQKFGYDPQAQTIYLSESGNARAPDASLCVDVTGGLLKNGNPVQVWSCNGCWNQEYSVVGPASSGLLDSHSIHAKPFGLGLPMACPPQPSPAPSPRPNLFGWACKDKNQHSWPAFKDKQSLEASPWGSYFKEMYGSVPDSPYPICTFDFWYLDKTRMAKHKVPTPTPLIPGVKNHQKHPVGSWAVEGIGQKWQAHLVHDSSNVVIPSNVWVEGIHSKVGGPKKGDETHGAWFFYAAGSGIWLWTGNTKAFKSHAAGANYLCGHSAKDPQVAKCAVKKGLDTYTFQAAWKVEIVRANGIGGYACTAPAGQTGNLFKSGWTAASSCNCVQSKGYVNCANGPPGTHPTASFVDPNSSGGPTVQV